MLCQNVFTQGFLIGFRKVREFIMIDHSLKTHLGIFLNQPSRATRLIIRKEFPALCKLTNSTEMFSYMGVAIDISCS